MKPEPQTAAPANSETADSQPGADGREDSNAREPQELPTNRGTDRDGWRAYFPAAVRKTVRRRDNESRSREILQKLPARFPKTLLL
jgi:hypothetical protein